MKPDKQEVSAGQPLEDMSTGALLGKLFKDGSQLLKKEIELVKAETRKEIQVAVARMVSIAIAATCAFLGVGLLCAMAVFGLAEHVPPWAAALIVAVVMFGIAGVLLAVAAKTHHRPLAKTQESMKENVQWAKEQIA